MRYAKPGWMLCAIVGACVGIIGSARAQDVLFTWSDGPWTGGGEITGSLIVNDSFPYPPGSQTGFVGNNALVSFQAHWTGNLYSQPYDWTLAGILASDSQFVWDVQHNALNEMQLYPGGAANVVEYTPELYIEDDRPGAIDPPGFQIPQYEELGTFSSTTEVLPEPGITQMFLGLAVPVLLLRPQIRSMNWSSC